MDHAMRAAGKHDVGSAVANEFGRFTDRLTAGSTGSQAIIIRPLKIEIASQMSRGRVRFLLELAARVKLLQASAGESNTVHVPPFGPVALGHEADQVMEVLDALAGA